MGELQAFRPDAWPLDGSLVEAVSSAVVATDLGGRILYWNPGAAQLYGYTAEQMTGASVMDLFVSPEDRAASDDIMDILRAGGTWSGEFHVRCADGSSRPVRITNSPLFHDGELAGIVGVAEDLTESKAARQDANLLATRMTRLAQVTAQLGSATTVEQVTDIVVAQAADAVGADVASMVLLEGDTLRMIGVRGVDPAVLERWTTFPADLHVPIADAARTGEPVVVIGKAAIEAEYPAMPARTREECVVALPLCVAERRLGAVGLIFPEVRSLDTQEMEFLRAMADSCAHALIRLEATSAAASTTAKLTFLASASEVLSGSLDYEQTLASVAQLAVPALADWCAVDVLHDGRLRTLATTHVDPAKVAAAHHIQTRYPQDMDSDSAAPRVARTGTSELLPDIADAMLVATARDEEHLRLLREMGFRSAVVVPLRTAGRILGVITLVYAESGRRYSEADLELVEDLARRAAMAIDNADLHTQTHEAAARLQRAVLPDTLPSLPGWELAAHYSPADRTDVGGDFYDCLRLPDGRLAVVVGDVIGRGLQAASQMAAVRAALRAFVSLDPDPGVVVTSLDRMFAAFEMSQFVTLVYAVIDHERDELSIINAGHLPPLLVMADGTVEPLDVPASLPLGVQPDERPPTRLPMPPGACLALFSDGLVERRGEDIDVGVGRLRALLATTPGTPLSRAIEDLATGLHDADRQDDVTLLLARRTAKG